MKLPWVMRLSIQVLLALAIAPAAWAQPTFSKAFSPDTIGPGSRSTLTFTITNGTGTPAFNLVFSDTLPAGVVIATPAAASTDCVNAVLSAPDGGSTISMTNARLGSPMPCTIRVDVTSNTPGTYTNVSGTLTSSLGSSGTAVDDLTVVTSRPGFSKSFSPTTVDFRGTSTLTFTIDNTANGTSVNTLAFSDIFPEGMTVATPPNAATDCVGATFTPSGESVSFFNGIVAAGSTCTASVDVIAGAAGRQVNRSRSLTQGSVTPVDSGFASAALDVNRGFLVKTFTDDPVGPGSNVTLEFTITNANRASATSITFTDDLDATLSGLTAVGPLPSNPCGPGSSLSGTSILTLTGGNLAAGASCTFSVPLLVPLSATEGTYPNTTSTVSATGIPTPQAAATDDLLVKGIPIITKSFTNDPVAAGGSVTLEFTITNTSLTSMATNIAFTDPLDEVVPALSPTLPPDGFCGAGSTMTYGNLGLNTLGLSMSGGTLAAGASCTFQVPLTLPSDAPAGTWPNTTSPVTATIDAETRQGPPATDNLVVIAAPPITKSFTNDPVDAGNTVTLEFTLFNSQNAPGDATAISFTDDLTAVLSGLTAVGLPGSNVCGSGSTLSGTTNLSLTGGTLVPGASCTFSVTLQVPANALPGTYTNATSMVSASMLGTPVVGSGTSAPLEVAGPRLTKAFIPNLAAPGDTVDLEFTISNQSTAVGSTNIAFTDDLTSVLSGLTAVGLPIGNVCGAGSNLSGTTTLTFTGGNLAPGTTCTFSVPVSIPPAATQGEYLNRTSDVSADFGGSPVTVAGASAVLSVSEQLSLTKAFTDDPGMLGGTVTLEFTITNADVDEAASNITFTDDLTATLSGLTAIGLPIADICGVGSSLSGTTNLTFSGGSLAPQASCTFNVALQMPVSIPAGTTAINTTSTVTGTVGRGTATGTAATAELLIDFIPKADLAITKAGPAAITPGEPAVYTITVRNNGPLAATGVRVTDSASSGLSLQSNSGACLTSFPCDLGTIPVGAVQTITSTFRTTGSLTADPIRNTATVSSALADPVAGNNSSSALASNEGISDVSLLVSGPQLAGGDAFSYQITLSNAGPSAASGVLLEVQTSPGVTAVPGAGSCTLFPCFIPSIPAGVSLPFTANFTLSGLTTSPMVTRIEALVGSIDPDPSNNVVIISTDTCPSAVTNMLPEEGALDVPRDGALTWTGINADSYAVYLGLVGDGCSTLVGTTTATSFTYPTLEWRTPYEWQVVATKNGCPTGPVVSACQTFVSGPPCPTLGPELIFPPQGGLDFLSPIRFEWSAVPAATAYRVWASIDNTPAVVLGETLGDVTSLVYQIIPGDIEWWVEVLSGTCPIKSSAHQTFTSSGSCVTRPALLTSPPDGVTLESPITFDWEPVGGAKGYSVWVSVDGEFPIIVASTTTETTATARVSSGDIRWFVESRFERCPPAISELRTITVPERPGCESHEAPGLIEPMSGERLLAPIEFSWTAVDEAISYAVWTAIDGDSPSIIATTEGETSIELDLRSGEIEWFVQAIFDQCPTTRSEPVSFTVLELASCDRDAPLPLAPSSGSTITDPLVTFEWTEVAGAAEYRVWISVHGGEPMLVTSTPATVQSARGRVPIGAIEWYVEAIFQGCPSMSSTPVSFTVPSSTTCNDIGPVALSPAAASDVDASLDVAFRWSSVAGAIDYVVWLVREDGTPTIIDSTSRTSTSIRIEPGDYVWYVEALLAGCPSLASEQIPFTVSAQIACENLVPSLLAPADGSVDLTSPVTFLWTDVKDATGYRLWIKVENAQPLSILTDRGVTEAVVPLPRGVTNWYVEAFVPECNSVRSTTSQLRVIELSSCDLPAAPAASVVGEITSGETYTLLWERVAGSTIYEVQQTTRFNATLGLPDYSSSSVLPTTNYLEFEAPELADGQQSIKIYYRVRGIADCSQQRGPYGASVSVVVTREDQSAQIGATGGVDRNLTLCADEAGDVFECDTPSNSRRNTAEVTVDLSTSEDWLIVSPTSGTIPAGGSLTVGLSADPSGLPTGTSTAALNISTGGSSRGTSASGVSLPISIGLATPVSQSGGTEPPPYSQIIPAVIHGDSATGTWQSDIRVLNNTAKTQKYQLGFTRSNVDGTQEVKKAVVEVRPGRMLAFNDIVRSWYGASQTTLTGVLEIRPSIQPSGSGKATIAASRTYNSTLFGTYGQFVPAVPFSDFVGRSDDDTDSRLLLQQLAQSSEFRTNFGLAESSGSPADVLIQIFDPSGMLLGETNISLKAGEHTQLNALLASLGILADDARAEVSVTSATGKITAYASVVDSRTLDPTFIPATKVGQADSTRLILPGVADFDTGLNRWRSDARLYNSSDSSIVMDLVFYPQAAPTQPITRAVQIEPGVVMILDDLLQTRFGVTNTGGALHVVTDRPGIIATARTYDQRDDGTVGQYIPGLTSADAAVRGGRVLNLLQVEESANMRTNLGLSEVSGSSALVEVTAAVPGDLVARTTLVNLRGFEFIQIGSIFRQLGYENVFNGRLYVRVINGDGQVVAYASSIDNRTGDPAYVPAQ